VLPVDFELITTVPAFVVSASATKSVTLFAVTDPPVTTKSSPVVKSLITSDPALTLKVSLEIELLIQDLKKEKKLQK